VDGEGGKVLDAHAPQCARRVKRTARHSMCSALPAAVSIHGPETQGFLLPTVSPFISQDGHEEHADERPGEQAG
jgi:hypothetical protein